MNLDTLQKIAEAATRWPGYFVDRAGNVWSTIPWRGQTLHKLTQFPNSHGYPSVKVRLDGKMRKGLVHIMVCEAAYIAACSPDVVLRLIAVARAAQPGLVALEASMKKMDEFSYRLVMAGRDPDRPLEAISALRSAIAELNLEGA